MKLLVILHTIQYITLTILPKQSNECDSNHKTVRDLDKPKRIFRHCFL